MKFYYTLFTLLIFITSCRKKEFLSACYNVTNENPIIGEVIDFTDCSTESTNVEWNFGDNDDSNIQNPSHKYADEGNYKVIQTVYDDLNEKKSISKIITCRYLIVDSVDIFIKDNGFSPIISISGNSESYFTKKDFKYFNEKYRIFPDDISNKKIPNELIKISVYTPERILNTEVNIYKLIDNESFTIEFKNNSTDVLETKIYFSRAEL